MLAFTLRRLVVALLVGFTVSVVAFALLRLSGDLAAAIAGPEATAEQVEAIRRDFGLNQPIVMQYFDWLWGAVRFDFGDSFFFRDTVASMIAERMPVTLLLGGLSIAFALILAIPLGVIAAVKQNTWIDRTALSIAVAGQAMPSFWFALILIIVFSVNLRWLPVSGSETWAHFVLPSIALGYYATPSIMRLTRTGMLDVLQSDYIRTARAKGLRPAKVLFKHALRNAVIPVVALAAVQFGFMLGGSIIIETIFSLQGLGHLMWESISRKDFPVVQAVLLLIALFYVLLTFVADLLNAWLDPRMRVS